LLLTQDMPGISNYINNSRKKALKQSSETAGNLKKFFNSVGDVSFFALRFFRETFRLPFEFTEFVRQCYRIGNKSLGLIAITGFIMGLVLTLQSQPVLAEFGAQSWLPGMVALSIVKEMGPVITALICAGKIGSGIGAELGSMKVTEQIDAMEVSAINPFRFLVVTRILACTLMIPVLVIFSDAIGIFGSYVGINIRADYSFRLFFDAAFASIDFIDFIPALIKSFFFGFVIGLIGCYKGYTAASGTESVGVAANSAVVAASLAVFVVDMIAVQISNMLV